MFKKVLSGLAIFAAGVVTGSIITNAVVKEKATREANEKAAEEIAEVREIYRNKTKKEQNEKVAEEESEKVAEEESEKVDPLKVKPQTGREDYNSYYKMTQNYTSQNEEKPKRASSISDLNAFTYEKSVDRPYIIDPEDYGEEDDYDTMQLTYFMGDKTLVDESADDTIDEPDLHIGLDNLAIFDEFQGASSIYVRNDILKMDFEILKDDCAYSDLQDEPEVKEKKPHEL